MALPTRTEIANGLNGTLLLARRDPAGVGWLDGSVDGFWKSFFAAVLLAPFYALMLWIARYADMPDADLGSVFLIELASYAGAWFFWPMIASELCRFLDQGFDARRYIVACNWSEVWIMLIRLPIVTLGVVGLLGGGIYSTLTLIALIVVLAYRYVIAKETLPANAAVAWGFAFADFLAGMLWRAGTEMAVAPYLVAS
ncbi:hypothetical protein [Minwuia sp.]|uniref:hypothetical protein n=1 Tax=Minwuia sp. TaxID=2493630 RepID=UPI003A8F6CE9